MNRAITLIVAGLAAVLAAGTALSHRDTSKPLFVAMDGSDEGRCQDPAKPCRSIRYALSQAGKGAQIRVGAGRYTVAQAEDLYLLVSGDVGISGGYDPSTGFAMRGSASSTLDGVPEEYRAVLRDRGFHVIADAKGAETPLARETGKLLAVQRRLEKGNQPGACVNGMVDNLACNNVDLLAHIPFSAISAQPTAGNDVWGFVDLNSRREYVIAGFNRGTAVFDINDPGEPREVGFVDGQVATWRDIKVYQFYDDSAERWRAYAYVTTDGSSDGLFVIDLGGLPHAIERVSYPSEFQSAHNVYSTSTDFSTGLSLTNQPHLIIAGSNRNVGQYRAYDLIDPASPQFVTGSQVPDLFDGSDQSYMHDAASLLITDARKDSQCVNAGEFCELLLDFNEEKVAIWDITDISDPQHLNDGDPEYTQRGYVHSGWWTEDRQYMFVHDELDEQQSNLNTTVRVFSLGDLSNPQQVGTFTGPTSAIDHNGYVRGNRYYMSNYKRGLTILDITDPGSPQESGHLDTYPASDGGGFSGAWGVYPFFPSGTIAVSDINSGVYLAKDQSRTVNAGSFAFALPAYAVEEGQQGQFTITRSNNSGAVSVDVDVVHGNADAADYTLLTPTLTWPDGDMSPRTINVAATADGNNEKLELLMLRLVNPTGGATLGELNTARVNISESGAAGELRLLENNIEIAERGFGKAVIVLQRNGSASGTASVAYSMTAGDATANDDFSGATSGTVTWADGDASPKWIEFDISDDGVTEETEFFELTLSNPTGASLSGAPTVRVSILNATGRNVAPNAVVAGNNPVNENTVATLNGSQSNDPNDDPLTYQWTQTSGPTVSINASTSAIATFSAPQVSSDTLLTFRLTVTDPAGLSDSAIANIVVTNVSPPPGGGGGGAPGALLLAALSLAAARRFLIRKDAV